MVTRDLMPELKRMARRMPVISITGPRQSGKTTLARQAFPRHAYVNLELPDQRAFAGNDPRTFLEQYRKGVILDEVQHVPELFSYLQVMADESRKNGLYVLSGSQNFLLLEKISQSLAGRVALFNLLPLSINELRKGNWLKKDYETVLLNGFYPRLYDNKLRPDDFFPSYIRTYVERDVRQLIHVRNLHVFQQFLKLCAGRIGQLVNYASLGNEVGIDLKTIKNWLSVLEAGFIVFFLRPYHRNFNKRLVKLPKLYFNDTGLACSLLGIKTPSQLYSHYHKGALFENMIIADLIKTGLNAGGRPQPWFWRDNTGHEIDCLLEEGGEAKAVEIKSGRTIHEDFFAGLRYYSKLSGAGSSGSFLVYGGRENQHRTGSKVLAWNRADVIIKG